MRWLVFLALVGCGEVSSAGTGMGGDMQASDAGGAAGTMAAAGTTGSAGTTGQGGTIGQAGTTGAGGAIFPPSCAVLQDTVSGTDDSAVWSSSNNQRTGCQPMTRTVQIVNGTYNDSSWTLSSYTANPLNVDMTACEAVFLFNRTTATCATETLYVHVRVPPI